MVLLGCGIERVPPYVVPGAPALGGGSATPADAGAGGDPGPDGSAPTDGPITDAPVADGPPSRPDGPPGPDAPRTMSGTAMTLSGRGDRADGPDDLLPSGRAPRTIELWLRTSSTVEQYAVSYGTLATTASILLGTIGRRPLITQNGDDYTSSTQLTPGRWHHVAASFDGTTYRLYVDGVLQGDKAMATATAVGQQLRLGDSVVGEDKPFTGSIDEVRIWSVARSEGDIAANRFRRFDSPPAELVAAYDFEGVTGGAGTRIPNRGSAGGALDLTARDDGRGTAPVFEPGGAF